MDDDDDDEEEAEAFMPTKANARKQTSDVTNKDSNAAKLPAVMADDDHHQWETIETVVVNGQDVDVDAGVILGDDGNKSASKRRCRKRRFRCVDVDDEPTCFESFWGGVEAILIQFRCWRFFKSLNMSVICDRVDEVSRKFFPIMFILLNFVYWVSYIYIL